MASARVSGGLMVALVFAACTSPPVSPLPHPSPSPDGGGRRFRDLEIGREISADGWIVLPEESGVWVAGAGTLSRIDVARSQTLQTAARGGWDYDYVDMASAGGGTILLASGQRLWSVDAHSGRTVGTLDLERLGYVAQVMQVGRSTWVSATAGREGALAKIDLDSGDVVERFVFKGGVGPFAAASGSFFFHGRAGLVRVDRRSGEVTRLSGVRPGGLVATGSHVWATTNGGGVRCIDARRLNPCGFIPMTRASALATDNGLLWVMSMTGSRSPTIYLPDPKQPAMVALYDGASGELLAGPLELPDTTPATIAAFRTRAWIGFHDSGQILRIDPVRSRSASG